jgi:hypothetical protein
MLRSLPTKPLFPNEDLPALSANDHTYHRVHIYQDDQHESVTESLTSNFVSTRISFEIEALGIWTQSLGDV